jgi:predicted DsbA family dithiol-disulfide isomerase
VVRDFPLTIHASAPLAAVAAACAADQGAFWEYSDQLFATHQVDWGGVPNRDQPVMLEMAAELGLDAEQFAACMSDPAVAQRVTDETNRAAQIGINSTPNFIVGDRLLRGAVPFSQFEALIEELLAQP